MGTQIGYAAMRCAVLSYAMCGTVLCDARYWQGVGRYGSLPLIHSRICCYGQCGTEIGYGAMRYAVLA
eukprot:3933990-Rhodomonas_salina.2